MAKKPPGQPKWDPHTIDPQTGVMRSNLAIQARRGYNSLEDIAAEIYHVDVRTIYRHMNEYCGTCHFCQGMKSAPAASRIYAMGKLQEYAGDPAHPLHWKALSLLATHAPDSPLRAKMEISGTGGGPVQTAARVFKLDKSLGKELEALAKAAFPGRAVPAKAKKT